jgi:hypothetical protein
MKLLEDSMKENSELDNMTEPLKATDIDQLSSESIH